jgi:hypothetical protein
MPAEERQHVVGIGVPPDHPLREDQLAVDVHVEDAADPRHELDGSDAPFELLENARCQTDSVRARASGNAVLDADAGAVGHDLMLAPEPRIPMWARPPGSPRRRTG